MVKQSVQFFDATLMAFFLFRQVLLKQKQQDEAYERQFDLFCLEVIDALLNTYLNSQKSWSCRLDIPAVWLMYG